GAERQGLLDRPAGTGQDLLPPDRTAARAAALLHAEPGRCRLLARPGEPAWQPARPGGHPAPAHPRAGGESPAALAAALTRQLSLRYRRDDRRRGTPPGQAPRRGR